MSAAGAVLAVYAAMGSALRAPTAVALDAVGNVHVCDSGNGRVVRFDMHAMVELQSYQSSSAAPLQWPAAMTLAADGSFWFVDWPDRVVHCSPNGAVATALTVRNPHTTRRRRLRGIAIAHDGAMYTADDNNHCVYKLSSTGEVVAVINTTNPLLSWPIAVALTSANGVTECAFHVMLLRTLR